MRSRRVSCGVWLGMLLAIVHIHSGSGCSGDTVLVVSLDGATPQVQSFVVSTVLDGIPAVGSQSFPGDETRFGLEFPTLATGALSLSIDALDATGCLLAQGQLATQLNGEAEVDVVVTLMSLSATQCNGQIQPTLAVTKAGNGTGTVTSQPAGISCGAQCSAEFVAGTQVTLTATPDGNMSFGGWTGACTGSAAACTVSVSGLTAVAATFTSSGSTPPPPAGVCSDPHWCWDNPLPQGNNLQHVWGTAANNYWAVGDLGMVLHYDGSKWNQVDSGIRTSLNRIWGRSATDIFAVGVQGRILHWDGTTWSSMQSGATADLSSIGGSGAKVFAVGLNGTVLGWDGTTWSPYPIFGVGTKSVRAVWGNSPTDIWLVGDLGAAAHYDGGAWTAMLGLDTSQNYLGLFGTSATSVWALGTGGSAYHYDGSYWSSLTVGLPLVGGFFDVWGSADSDIWAVAGLKTQLYWNGKYWNDDSNPNLEALRGVFGSSTADVWMVGPYGVMQHYDGNLPWREQSTALTRQTLTSIWGSATTDVWAIGPDTSLHWNGTAWSTGIVPGGLAIHGSSAQDIWVVGASGKIYHFDGTHWNTSPSGVSANLNAVYALAPNRAWAVGESVLLSWDGASWTSTNSPYRLLGVWAAAANDAWAVGQDVYATGKAVILHWDGSSWTSSPSSLMYPNYLDVVSGSAANNVWAGGLTGSLLHWDGAQWNTVPGPGAFGQVLSLWVNSPSQVWTLTNAGVVHTWNGTAWKDSTTVMANLPYNMFVLNANQAWVVGDGGAILHYQP